MKTRPETPHEFVSDDASISELIKILCPTGDESTDSSSTELGDDLTDTAEEEETEELLAPEILFAHVPRRRS